MISHFGCTNICFHQQNIYITSRGEKKRRYTNPNYGRKNTKTTMKKEGKREVAKERAIGRERERQREIKGIEKSGLNER